MGRLLESLRAATAPAATPATPATIPADPGQESQSRNSRKGSVLEYASPNRSIVAESQESQRSPIDTAQTRATLLAHADTLGADPALIRALSEAELAEYAAVPEPHLAGYVALMMDTATRHAGRAPEGDTAAIYCNGCGPVFVHPTIAACLPVVAEWPRALGCVWCAVRGAGGHIPRPRVRCEGCQHYQPDTVNPGAGLGGCSDGHGSHYPMQRHGCAGFSISVKK